MAHVRALAIVCLVVTGCGSSAASPSVLPTGTPGASATVGASATPPGATDAVTPAPTVTTPPTVPPTTAPTEPPGVITPDTFVAAADMHQARRGQDGVLLHDGRVLAAGGESGPDADDITDGAEVYDAATDTWTEVGPMLHRRAHAVVVVLADGRVLIAGGKYPGDHVNESAEIFDPATNSFSATGAMNRPRTRAAGVLLDDGTVLVVGGANENGDALDSAEIYDPASGVWTLTGAMHDAREAPSAIRLADGRVIVAGGSDAGDPRVSESTTEMYNPDDATFEEIGAMADPRNRFNIALLGDGRVLIAGGESDGDVLRSAELFDPLSGATIWTETVPLDDRRYAFGMVTMADGNAFVCGGFNGDVNLRGCEIYDAASNTWTNADSLISPAGGPLMVTLADGRILVCGGGDNRDRTIKSCQLFTEVGQGLLAAPRSAAARR